VAIHWETGDMFAHFIDEMFIERLVFNASFLF